MKFKVHGGGGLKFLDSIFELKGYMEGGDSVIEHYSKYTNPRTFIQSIQEN